MFYLQLNYLISYFNDKSLESMPGKKERCYQELNEKKFA